MSKPSYYIDVVSGLTGNHWWRVRSASNGQIVLTSETYHSKSNARRAARRFAAATGLRIGKAAK